jgi:hypothetical protein
MQFPNNENSVILKNMQKIHNPSVMDRLRNSDAFFSRHSTAIQIVGAVFLLIMTTVALNLGLGRPWF